MNIFTIYKATNKNNGKSYIGFDKSWPKRIHKHFNKSKNNSQYIFHRAIRKDGKEAFEWSILYQSLDGQHTLNVMEGHFIEEYNSFMPNGYNMTMGGDGLLSPTLSIRKKISKANLGNQNALGSKRSPDSKKLYSLSKLGNKNPMFGKHYKHKNSTKIKISLGNSKKWKIINPSNKIYIITNLLQFCLKHHISSSKMCIVAQGKAKHHKKWKCSNILL